MIKTFITDNMVKETEEAKRANFFKIIILLADIVVDVFRRFVTHKLPPEQDIYQFLTKHQHALHHKWIYNIPCCRPDCDIETRQQRKPKICLMHFETMYNTSGREKEGHEQRENGMVLQHCICKVSVKSGVYMGGLDLSTCYLLLTDFLMISSQQKKWLKCILEQRNAINKKLNDKSLDKETFSPMWEQIEVPLLLIATEIDSSFSEDIFEKIKTLSKRTPSAKTYVKSYEMYLEWFSRDDILSREIKHAKQQRMQQAPSGPNLDGDKNVLLITEVIMIDLLKNEDDVETAIQRHPPDEDITLKRHSPDGMETREKSVDQDSNTVETKQVAFLDTAISGANSASKHQMDVVITYNHSTEADIIGIEGDHRVIAITNQCVIDPELKEKEDNDVKEKLTEQPKIDLGITKQSPEHTRQQVERDGDEQQLTDSMEQTANRVNKHQSEETEQDLEADVSKESLELNEQKENNGINKHSTEQTTNEIQISKLQDFYQTVITLEIPGKTRWQNMALIRNLKSHVSQLNSEKIKISLFSIELDSVCIHADMAAGLFHSRPTLRESLSELLHKMFQFCMTNDSFSVNVTLQITDPGGVDASLFITEDSTTKVTTKDDSVNVNNVPFNTEPKPSTVSQQLEKPKGCTACKIKDKEIHNLYKQIKMMKTAKPRPPPVLKCRECALKEKRLFMLEQEKLKAENENQQKDRLISSLQSDIQSKDRAMLTYDKLEQTNALLDKQRIVGNHLIENKVPHLKSYASNFYTRPYSEPPEIVTRLPFLPKAVGKYMHIERPITEQVLKKPNHPSVSFTQKKYLSSIRRYNDFLPVKKNAVLRYSYSEPKRRGPFQILDLPPLYSFTTDKLFQRPISVRGKHMVAEKSESFIGSSKEAGKRSKIIEHLSLPKI